MMGNMIKQKTWVGVAVSAITIMVSLFAIEAFAEPAYAAVKKPKISVKISKYKNIKVKVTGKTKENIISIYKYDSFVKKYMLQGRKTYKNKKTVTYKCNYDTKYKIKAFSRDENGQPSSDVSKKIKTKQNPKPSKPDFTLRQIDKTGKQVAVGVKKYARINKYTGKFTVALKTGNNTVKTATLSNKTQSYTFSTKTNTKYTVSVKYGYKEGKKGKVRNSKVATKNITTGYNPSAIDMSAKMSDIFTADTLVNKTIVTPSADDNVTYHEYMWWLALKNGNNDTDRALEYINNIKWTNFADKTPAKHTNFFKVGGYTYSGSSFMKYHKANIWGEDENGVSWIRVYFRTSPNITDFSVTAMANNSNAGTFNIGVYSCDRQSRTDLSKTAPTNLRCISYNDNVFKEMYIYHGKRLLQSLNCNKTPANADEAFEIIDKLGWYFATTTYKNVSTIAQTRIPAFLDNDGGFNLITGSYESYEEKYGRLLRLHGGDCTKIWAWPIIFLKDMGYTWVNSLTYDCKIGGYTSANHENWYVIYNNRRFPTSYNTPTFGEKYDEYLQTLRDSNGDYGFGRMWNPRDFF